MSPRRLLVATLLAGTLARLAGGWAMGLGVDESYQVANADTFQLSYFDHPPLAFWMLWATKRLVHAAPPLVLRLPFIVLTALSTLLVARLGAWLHDARAGAFTALLFNLAPLWGIAGGWALPDVPLTLGTLLAASGIGAALARDDPHRAWRAWLTGGMGLGIALLSKYHAALLVAGVVAFLAMTPAHRRRFIHPAPWVAALVGLAMASPVLVWNAQHGWASVAFQGGRAALGARYRPADLATGLLGPALFLAPWLWWPLLREGARAFRRGRSDERGLLLACLAAPAVLLFSLLPLLGVRVLAHWAGPGFLLLVPLLGREAAMRLDAPSDRAVRRWLRFAIIATPVLWLAVLPQAAWSAWRRAIPSWPPALDPTHEVVSWQDLRQWAGRQGYLGRPDLFVATSNWRDGGKATVALGAELPVLVLGPDPRNFAFSRDVHHMVGRDAVLVAREERLAELIATCRPRFAAIEPLGTLPITRGGQVELRLGLALAHGFVAPR